MNIRLASDEIMQDSIVDGKGLRTVVFIQGCRHHCQGCHNPQTWDFEGGVIKDTSYIVQEALNNPLSQGVTFSGGDPLEQAEACTQIIISLKEKGYNGDFWAYTGYTFENLLQENDPSKMNLLACLDVLVDGRFVLAERSLNTLFRGSRNQRLIHVPKSLEAKCVIEV